MLRVKRVYADAEKGDGLRVLVDRIWPRGLSKKEAGVDRWLKEIAPTNALRRWFGHDPEKWDEFRRRYAEELEDKAEDVQWLVNESRKKTVTLLYGAKDERHNNAVALKEYLEDRIGG
jgi:uncharacterized protein YeaO (DUF488 family)